MDDWILQRVLRLALLQRFPQWMWRNTDVLQFIEWLQKHNSTSGPNGDFSVGFYGMDVYSLHSSADSVIQYLEEVDPDAAVKARKRYGCYAK